VGHVASMEAMRHSYSLSENLKEDLWETYAHMAG